MLLTKHEGETFQNQTVYISGQAFIRCKFIACTLVLRGETVLLGPDAQVSVDVERFEELAAAALAATDAGLARTALAFLRLAMIRLMLRRLARPSAAS